MKSNRNKAIGGSVIAAIIITALSYVGMQEKPNNSGFQSAPFEAAMKQVGWHKYDSWCVYFAKLCWYQTITNDTVRELAMKLISGNSQTTLANFKKDTSGRFILTDSAEPASIVIWQTYKDSMPQWSGHAGIVTRCFPNYFETVEGNTNSAGGSNGYIVAEKIRNYKWNTTNGLRLKKFIGINTKKYKP